MFNIKEKRKIATESDLLINDELHEDEYVSQSIPDSLSFISRVKESIKLIAFTICWVSMFTFFPFWVYSFRLPMLEYEHFTNVFTFIFFFFCFFSWVIFLMNHFAPVAATIELFRPTTQSIQTEDLKGKKVTVAVASIFCREKCFHIVRNFLGITNSWLNLDSVLEKVLLPNGEKTEINYVHYILDNTGAPGSLAILLRSLTEFLTNDPTFVNRIAPGLAETPVQPTHDEYSQFFPKDLRSLISNFLATISRDHFEIFSPINELTYERVLNKANHRSTGIEMSYQKSNTSATTNERENQNKNNSYCCVDENGISQCFYTREDIAFKVGKLNITIAILSAHNSHDRGKAISLIHAAKAMKKEFPLSVNFFGIFDARHMMMPRFWERTIPHFFQNGKELTSLRWVQVMQYFSEVDKKEDYFDRGNFFNYLYANALRDQISSTTSCGTNALWSMRDHSDGEPFLFKGETKIEDTETSHHCFTYGEDSTYVAEKLVYGSVKDPVEYGEAPSRWAAGAMQLLIVEMKRSYFMLPCILFIYVFIPFILSFFVFFLEKIHFIIAILELCVLFLLFAVVPYFRAQKTLARYLIRIVNVSYWLQGPFLAIFWMNILPILLLVSPTFPIKLDVFCLTLGSCVILFLQWMATSITKSWAGAKEVHIWRSQQVWYSLWPLMFAGLPSLCTGGKMWTISSNQSIFTFVCNSIQILAIMIASIYAIYDIHTKVYVNQNQIQFQDMGVCGSRLMGLMFGSLSLALILPITISLISMICGSKNSRGIRMSMRHLQLIFLIAVLVSMFYIVGINWQNVGQRLSAKFALGWPSWNPPSWNNEF